MKPKYIVKGSGKERNFENKTDAVDYIKSQLSRGNMNVGTVSIWEDGSYHLIERWSIKNGKYTKVIPQ